MTYLAPPRDWLAGLTTFYISFIICLPSSPQIAGPQFHPARLRNYVTCVVPGKLVDQSPSDGRRGSQLDDVINDDEVLIGN